MDIIHGSASLGNIIRVLVVQSHGILPDLRSRELQLRQPSGAPGFNPIGYWLLSSDSFTTGVQPVVVRVCDYLQLSPHGPLQ